MGSREVVKTRELVSRSDFNCSPLALEHARAHGTVAGEPAGVTMAPRAAKTDEEAPITKVGNLQRVFNRVVGEAKGPL